MDADEVRFGPFRLDLAQRRLFRDDAPVQVGSRAVEILRVLAQAKGELVTKDELIAAATRQACAPRAFRNEATIASRRP